jgi:transposase
LGGWEGCEVTDAQRFEAGVRGPRPQVWIELRPQFGRRMICDGCGEPVEKLHDQEVRVVRDLPIFDAETHLRLLRCGVACPRCGPRLERLTWLDRGLSPPWLFRNDESK